MSYRVKTNYDRGYVNAMDKVRVFIESNQKVMYVNTDEYKNAKNARSANADERFFTLRWLMRNVSRKESKWNSTTPVHA